MTMRHGPTVKYVVRGAVTIVVLAILAFLTVYATRQPHQAAPLPNVALPTTSTSAPLNAPSQVAPSSTGISAPISDKPAGKLDVQLSRFVDAYFLIRSSDTADSRRQRLQALGLVSDQALQQLDLTLAPADVTVQQQGSTVNGRADTRNMSVEVFAVDNGTVASLVLASVTVTITDATGKPVSSMMIDTSSEWRYVNNQWTIVRFVPEGGG